MDPVVQRESPGEDKRSPGKIQVRGQPSKEAEQNRKCMTSESIQDKSLLNAAWVRSAPGRPDLWSYLSLGSSC